MSRRAARTRGFTLLEIAVALAILGIGMVACMQVFSGSLRLQDAPRARRARCCRRGPRWTRSLFEPPKTLQIESTISRGLSHPGHGAGRQGARRGAGAARRHRDRGGRARRATSQVDVDWEDGSGVEDLHAEDPAPCVSTRRSWGRTTRMTTRRPSRAAGFTLLEVVLAMSCAGDGDRDHATGRFTSASGRSRRGRSRW